MNDYLIPREMYYPMVQNPITPESPETAVARQEPNQILKLLERESERRRYNEAIKIGENLANTFIRCTSQSDLEKIENIRADPDMPKKGFFGQRTRGRGLTLTINRKK